MFDQPVPQVVIAMWEFAGNSLVFQNEFTIVSYGNCVDSEAGLLTTETVSCSDYGLSGSTCYAAFGAQSDASGVILINGPLDSLSFVTTEPLFTTWFGFTVSLSATFDFLSFLCAVFCRLA